MAYFWFMLIDNYSFVSLGVKVLTILGMLLVKFIIVRLMSAVLVFYIDMICVKHFINARCCGMNCVAG